MESAGKFVLVVGKMIGYLATHLRRVLPFPEGRVAKLCGHVRDATININISISRACRKSPPKRKSSRIPISSISSNSSSSYGSASWFFVSAAGGSTTRSSIASCWSSGSGDLQNRSHLRGAELAESHDKGTWYEFMRRAGGWVRRSGASTVGSFLQSKVTTPWWYYMAVVSRNVLPRLVSLRISIFVPVGLVLQVAFVFGLHVEVEVSKGNFGCWFRK